MNGLMARAPLGASLALAGAMMVGALATPGCGTSSAGPVAPKFAGRITYNGQALTNQMIVFTPKDAKYDNWGMAVTDAEGNFAVSACLHDDSLAPGVYNIFLRKRPGSRNAEEGDQREGRAATATAVELPDRFYSAEQSGIWAKVERNSRWIQIDLRSEPKA
ncbi:hypothetical protein [Aquisphaera insulae]|uniref:hypothetical protein n=1 Tax=Aquisphaera insulae TaxID=2712864 RepID=UPI0013ECB984|nr:hypothetical protein [Aquisphaera insulae]